VAEQYDALSNVKRVAGSSAGAIAASALACGADAEFLARQLESLDIGSLMDDSPGFLRDAWRLYSTGGIAKGASLNQFLGKALRDLTGDADVTFGQAFQRTGRELTVVSTSMNRRRSVYHSTLTTPDMPIRTAVVASASFPLVFPLVQHDNDALWDGGLLDNFPIHIYDRSVSTDKHTTRRWPNIDGTVGLKLLMDDDLQPPPVWPVNNVFDAIKGVVSCWHDTALRVHVNKRLDWPRTVPIKVGSHISSMDFSIDAVQRQTLVKAGADAAETFFSDKQRPDDDDDHDDE
jgi:NTE family protein